MAQILCDCGCGEIIDKPVFRSNAHRMRFVRHGALKTVPEAPVVRQDAPKKKNAPEGSFAQNKYGEWKDGVWVPND